MYFWKPGDAKCAEISSAFGLAASENERENIRFAAINLENCEEIGRKYDVDKYHCLFSIDTRGNFLNSNLWVNGI